MNNELRQIKEFIEKLNKASDEYYNNKKQSMTDSEWDQMFDWLKQLEEITGIIYANSPTQNAGYPVADNLDKIKHSTPLLSLGKTKSVDDLKKFLGDREGVLMYKMDGGTQIADYTNYNLNYLATRGSSSTNEGQDITHNSKAIIGIPNKVDKNHIQVVGEGIMYKSKLEEINSILPEDERYANARNLANASSSMLDANRVASREVRFIAFGALESLGFETKMNELKYLKEQGFEVVNHALVNKDNIEENVKLMTSVRPALDFDIDGLVLAHNDLEHGRSLGKTSHHFKNAIAYKFKDDEEETILRNIIVDVGKSGQVSYVAEFDSVELCGTKVSKATLNNYDFISNLEIGIGDTIKVMKRNEIIPYVSDNLTRSNTYPKATECPVCGSELVHEGVHQFCKNFGCERQVLGRLVHFCSRDAMDIRGMSEETIKAIMSIKDENGNSVLYIPSDIYDLPSNKEVLYHLGRFGKKKVDNICKAIKESKNKPLNNVIYSLSIPQIGRTASKKIANKYKTMDNILENATREEIVKLIGDSAGNSFFDNFFGLKNAVRMIWMLRDHGVQMTMPQEEKSNKLEGVSFVVTGSVEIFKNRKELQAKIESLGGKVSGSVSNNTNYLLNNDIESSSSKNKKAKQLGVEIITEEMFVKMIE